MAAQKAEVNVSAMYLKLRQKVKSSDTQLNRNVLEGRADGNCLFTWPGYPFKLLRIGFNKIVFTETILQVLLFCPGKPARLQL
jgi:hypothetical protein